MKSARDRWFERLHAERERRRDTALMVDGRNPREVLAETLTLMGQRLASAPGFVEWTEAEQAKHAASLDKWFRDRDHGYGR
jgi:hypothetical protein